MAYELTAQVLRSDLPTNLKMVLAALADECRNTDNPVCWPGTARIMAFSSLSKSTVKKALRELKKRGLINWTVRPGEHSRKNQTNLYTLDIGLIAKSLHECFQTSNMGATETPIDARSHHQEPQEGAGLDPEPITKPINNKNNLHSFQLGLETPVPEINQLWEIWVEYQLQTELTDAGITNWPRIDLSDAFFRFKQYHERQLTQANHRAWVNLLRGWIWNRAEQIANRQGGGIQ